MLSLDAVLDLETLKSVLASGHSRIPVYRDGDRCLTLTPHLTHVWHCLMSSVFDS